MVQQREQPLGTTNRRWVAERLLPWAHMPWMVARVAAAQQASQQQQPQGGTPARVPGRARRALPRTKIPPTTMRSRSGSARCQERLRAQLASAGGVAVMTTTWVRGQGARLEINGRRGTRVQAGAGVQARGPPEGVDAAAVGELGAGQGAWTATQAVELRRHWCLERTMQFRTRIPPTMMRSRRGPARCQEQLRVQLASAGGVAVMTTTWVRGRGARLEINGRRGTRVQAGAGVQARGPPEVQGRVVQAREGRGGGQRRVARRVGRMLHRVKSTRNHWVFTRNFACNWLHAPVINLQHRVKSTRNHWVFTRKCSPVSLCSNYGTRNVLRTRNFCQITGGLTQNYG
ncbi:hypothetical protein VOLCADRAFT_107748 [Volvox carteri f. nagariensis]|uniref:Uncharacterized protein n=1 Tax=Volvox carteri f. nagariensis TaxID=3068 RepID=D8UG23_VOLCA|nr:uncharacterized protein VOLCADRAFT_107748 [Volvox carteri f. nagariensis]EFJ41274.1 hypothetical protein VOLCADRAFT_107748 [Volvox carteri f. nagariensis]|eukprot:XP_002957608.1 hypothetical protein VOLCADRAFT_107748 [Volvox carteri f. nagariensis]